jgi:ferredoxin-NADP reductase
MNMTVAAPAQARWQQASIERITHPTPNIASVLLNGSLRRHVAGQHVDVRLSAADGYQAQRSYSIASAPGAPAIELIIEKLDDGEVSPYFHEVAQAGDTIDVRGPIGGHFIWRVEDGGPLLLVAGGSGIAPLMAIARERAVLAPEIPALLIYSARTWEDMVFRQELMEIQARQPEFRFVAITTRGPSPRPGDFGRRIDQSMIREVLAGWDRTPRHAYVCGSNAFVETAASSLVAENLPANRIRTERYGGSA